MNSWFMIIFILGIMSFTRIHAHLLATLISLELLALAVFILVVTSPIFFFKESFFSLLYIALAVCEGALGVSLIVLLVRSKGNELLSSTSTLLW